MRMVAGRQAPAVLSTDAKREVRQEAMSFILAGIVASLVLTTFKVCACLAVPLSQVLYALTLYFH